MSWRHGQRPAPKKWAEVRKRALERDRYRCVKCGKPGGPLEVDHIKPLENGGGHV